MKIKNNDLRTWKRFTCFAQLSCLKSRFNDAWLMPKHWYCFVLWKYWIHNWEIILNSIANTEMTSHRVDSDLRTLFAIGKLDDYEKLKKECGETSVVLKGMEARIQERLKIFRNMSPREVRVFINHTHLVRVFSGGIALKSVQVNGAIMSSQLILLSSRVEKATRSVYKNVIWNHD